MPMLQSHMAISHPLTVIFDLLLLRANEELVRLLNVGLQHGGYRVLLGGSDLVGALYVLGGGLLLQYSR